MSLTELILLGLALSADSVAVSVTNGLRCDRINLKLFLYISFCFAFFQAVMPVLGYLASFALVGYIYKAGRFISFFLLLFIGAKMIYSSFAKKKDVYACFKLSKKLILTQSIATSVDALAVGVSFAALRAPILKASCIIFALTFISTFWAAFFGSRLARIFKFKSELVGGVILIFIGLEILLRGQ